MKLTDYMRETKIAERVERSRVAHENSWRSDWWRLKIPEDTMHGSGEHFPNLDVERARLAERGIDAERSFREFMVEIKVQGPPQRLLDDIFGGGIPGVSCVDDLFGMAA